MGAPQLWEAFEAVQFLFRPSDRLLFKMGGLKAIASALNAGDVARAQTATVLLAIPNPPAPSKGRCSRDAMIKFIRDLHWSELIKWNGDSARSSS